MAMSLEYTIFGATAVSALKDLADPVLPELRFRHLTDGSQDHVALVRDGRTEQERDADAGRPELAIAEDQPPELARVRLSSGMSGCTTTATSLVAVFVAWAPIGIPNARTPSRHTRSSSRCGLGVELSTRTI